MIRLESASKVYRKSGGEIRALDQIDLEINAGEFVAVRGPSGCGKSTLLMLAGGLIRPTSGRVIVDGRDLVAMSPSESAAFRAETIGFVFQLFHLLPYLTVWDNVAVAASPADRDSAGERVGQLLKDCGLADRRDHRPGQLSAGQRQRVALARAMFNSPPILLADEPTGNLDPENATAVLELLAEYHRSGGTILLVTHDDAATRYAQRTILLREGRCET